MNCTATRLTYQQTGYFPKIVTDYLSGSANLRPFYQHPVSLEGIKSAIKARQQFATNRPVLVDELRKQYQSVRTSTAVKNNLDLLLQDNCFTVTTAHQPAIFTGTLYFIYKILHAIRLASQLGRELPDYRFVPVFYMGCEDADLDELGKIFLDQQEIRWDTKQTGAVGRMKAKGLEKIIQRIEGEFSVQPFGAELVRLLKECYLESENIQSATFRLIDALFAEYGLVVLIPDNPNLKKLMVPVFEDDLFNQGPSKILSVPISQLAEQYKIQAQPRDINLFYLKDNLRGRIEKVDGKFMIHDSKLIFESADFKRELHQFPDRFSPNVILRGLFQETLLPNIAFLGGGGELSYWLEFKSLFDHYQVPYPLLLLRNSFLIVEKKWEEKLARAGLNLLDIFRPEQDLINDLVKKESDKQLDLEEEIAHAHEYYEHLKNLSGSIDPTLTQHVEALQSKAIKPIRELEKKFLKAEKRKFEEQHRQVALIRASLFPFNSLQERTDNFIPYYSRWGKAFIETIYKNSLALEQLFIILQEK